MQFLYPTLTWAFLLMLVPLLIHLINLMRQRKVEWAAMEFLLKSHRKHRRWVWLKQFLLLLLRMLLVAAAVAMLAGLITKDQATFLGSQATHHFILVDDSLSMADRASDGRAFDMANQALRRISEQLANQPTDQKVTMIRFSQATKAAPAGETLTDMNAVTVDSDFPETMEEIKRRFGVSELSIGPASALELADRLVANAAEKSRMAYIVSDFRAKEWNQSSELKEALRSLRKNDCEIHLIRCMDAVHQNVAVVDVLPESGTLAAGVPLLVNVKVRNHGPSAAQQVSIRVSAKSYPADVVVGSDDQIVETQVSSLVIDEIPAGEVASRQAQLKFDRAGQHVVTASLASDALMEDNVRRCLVEIPPAIPVLIVDGSGQGEESYYLQSVFAPGRVVTGINAVSRDTAYLRDVADTELDRYAAVYLLNVERLENKAEAALIRYVENGGGLGIFVGPNSDPGYLVEMYAEGEGLFPLPVQAERQNLRGPGDDSPDLQVHDHPIFRVLVDEGGNNRPLTRRIRVDRFLGLDPAWTPEMSPNTRVLATIRHEDPVVAARRFGRGQVVAFLTTASPTWNNWARGPSYPVVLLQLHGFLSATRTSFPARLTGQPIDLQIDNREFRPQVEFVLPEAVEPSLAASSGAIQMDEIDGLSPPDSSLTTFWLGGHLEERSGETDRSGVYVANLISLDGQKKQRRFVVNPPTSESDLAMLRSPELAEQLDELGVVIHSANEMEYESAQQDGFSWSSLLAGMMIVMLLGEQCLAYSASYHPKGGNDK